MNGLSSWSFAGNREEGTGERRDMDRASSGEPCLQGNPGLGLSVPEQGSESTCQGT